GGLLRGRGCCVAARPFSASVFLFQSSEDIRCKCICPPYRNISGHIYNQNAALEAALPGGDRLQGRGAAGGRPQGELALFRSQVIIVIYLSVVGALLLYMAFLMLVDPLIRKPDAYTERLHNEEENERWKLQVQEQRKTVFDRHKMLS
ncbi:hypothetical protein E2I00_010402, partial [Balaenoptera physalus]